eukprot:gene20319-26376_t
MAPSSSTNPKDLVVGAILQCLEAITVGMPFEVWKTHMGTYRNQGTIEAFRNIYKSGGIGAFWKGWQPKMIESALKGGILLYSKEALIRFSKSFGLSDLSASLIGGFGGGVAQVTVLGPCTFLVTAAVTGDKSVSIIQRATQTYKTQGIGGFYHGGTALMLRQGSNWASRQAITELVRGQFKARHKNPEKAKLSILEEAVSGIIGGALSTWNQPFEVLRIEAQVAATRGLPSKNIFQTYKHIVTESGHLGLFQGIAPRIGMGIGQTLFLVTVPNILKQYNII